MPDYDPYRLTPYTWSNPVCVESDTRKHPCQQPELRNSLPNYYNMQFSSTVVGK